MNKDIREIAKEIEKETGENPLEILVAEFFIQHDVKLVMALRKQYDSFMQILNDPENQPTQYGTVTLEYMEIEIAKEREARAKVCDEQAGSSSEGENEPYILRPLKLKEVK